MDSLDVVSVYFGLWTVEFLFRSNVGIRKPQRGIYGDY